MSWPQPSRRTEGLHELNGSTTEIIRVLGRLEGGQDILLTEVRDIRRDLATHGERITRVEIAASASKPAPTNVPIDLGPEWLWRLVLGVGLALTASPELAGLVLGK